MRRHLPDLPLFRRSGPPRLGAQGRRGAAPHGGRRAPAGAQPRGTGRHAAVRPAAARHAADHAPARSWWPPCGAGSATSTTPWPRWKTCGRCRRGHINLAVSHSSAEQLVPEVIEAAMKNYPGVTYSVRSGSGENILKWVANGESDIGFCLRRKPPPGVEEVRAFPQHLGLVTPPGHPLAAAGRAAAAARLPGPPADPHDARHRAARHGRPDRPPRAPQGAPAGGDQLGRNGAAAGAPAARASASSSPRTWPKTWQRGTLVWTGLADAGARSFELPLPARGPDHGGGHGHVPAVPGGCSSLAIGKRFERRAARCLR